MGPIETANLAVKSDPQVGKHMRHICLEIGETGLLNVQHLCFSSLGKMIFCKAGPLVLTSLGLFTHFTYSDLEKGLM